MLKTQNWIIWSLFKHKFRDKCKKCIHVLILTYFEKKKITLIIDHNIHLSSNKPQNPQHNEKARTAANISLSSVLGRAKNVAVLNQLMGSGTPHLDN